MHKSHVFLFKGTDNTLAITLHWGWQEQRPNIETNSDTVENNFSFFSENITQNEQKLTSKNWKSNIVAYLKTIIPACQNLYTSYTVTSW